MIEPRERSRYDGLAVLAALLPTLGAWIYFVLLQGDDRARAVYFGSKLVQFLLPVLWLWAIGRKRSSNKAHRTSGLALGALSGLVMGGALFAWYRFALVATPLENEARGRIAATLENFGIGTPLAYLGMALGLSVLHSLLEEYYWRWFVYSRFAAWLPQVAAIALSSLAFASHHYLVVARYVPREALWSTAVPATLAIAVGGAFWCWLYRRTGNLLAPWLSHALVDAALMVLGYQLTFGARG